MKALSLTVVVLLLGACDGPAETPAKVQVDDGTAVPLPELPGTGEDVGRTVVYRDTFGVPHIYAPTVEAGLYAQGWAQAEDRPEQLLVNLKIALGELTEISGEDGVATSLLARMFRHLENARAAVAGMSEGERRRLGAFANGVSDFYAAHPEDVPAWWQHAAVTPEMIDAFGRMFLYNWSVDEALGDLERGGVTADFVTTARGSNQWAVSPARSASGHAILLIDPHLSWWGPSRFWEMRIHAGELEGSGVTLAGSPYIGLGHNAHLAWAMTTGGPDTADVYALALDETGERYRYDGAWRPLERHSATLTFPDGSAQVFEWTASHHGPVVARSGATAYAARIAYDAGSNRNRAWEAFNFAKDFTGAVEACATLSLFPQNVMAADTGGNIYYQRTGRVPVRDLDYDWSKPVDGTTSATEWQGFHPAEDHLSVLNPPAGYLQNCNVPPDAMIPNGPFSLEAQPHYLYSSRDHGLLAGWTNQRGARAIELLAADDDVTIEDALAYAVDARPFGVDRWLAALAQAAPPGSPELTELLDWDGQLTRDSVSALRYYFWRRALNDLDGGRAIAALVDDHYAIVEQRPPRSMALGDAEEELLRQAWRDGLAAMQATLGGTSEPWGRVFRVGREGVSWPVGGGGDPTLGLSTLRAMGYAPPDAEQVRLGISGQTSTQVVLLSKPIQSWIYLPVGQSDRQDSPHYRDQAESVFSGGRLKPSWWRPEDLADHIESRAVLKARY